MKNNNKNVHNKIPTLNDLTKAEMENKIFQQQKKKIEKQIPANAIKITLNDAFRM